MSEKIKTIIIDDEKSSIIILQKLLEKNCEQVEIVATAQSVEEGINVINEHKPNLVFLDINMPDGDGFEVLERVENKIFEVVFTTAYDKYAIKAFEFAALHYLLKPIKPEDLTEAVQRYEEAKNEDLTEKIQVYSNNSQKNPERLILPSSNGITIVHLDEIIKCESSNNYTTFFLKNNEKIMVSKSINTYEKILSESHFCRVHNQHIVNLKLIKKYIKGRGGYIVMTNDMHIDVSESRKKEFLTRLGEFAIG